MPGETGLLARHPWVERRQLTVAEYHRMAEAGILDEDDRLELIEGEIVAMSAVDCRHSGTVNSLTRILMQALGDRAVIAVQNPVRLGDRSEPQPDLTVLRPRADDYRNATPVAEDVLLLIEVANSSLAYDREVKLALYARHGIAELWIIDLRADEMEICRTPAADRYADVQRVSRAGSFGIALLPGVAVSLAWDAAH